MPRLKTSTRSLNTNYCSRSRSPKLSRSYRRSQNMSNYLACCSNLAYSNHYCKCSQIQDCSKSYYNEADYYCKNSCRSCSSLGMFCNTRSHRCHYCDSSHLHSMNMHRQPNSCLEKGYRILVWLLAIFSIFSPPNPVNQVKTVVNLINYTYSITR